MSNTNWKILGRNSGNMSSHRNVKASKLNYEEGKWTSIYDASGNKKIIHDISTNSGKNVVVGIGTATPFSRLSLGSNPGDGVSTNVSTCGQIAALAIHEESNGKGFHGLTYKVDVSKNETDTVPAEKVNALALYSNSSTSNLNLDEAKAYLTDDGVLRIGGLPQVSAANAKTSGTAHDPSIKLSKE